jgi:ABC-2 type transport system ATP-binding protein
MIYPLLKIKNLHKAYCRSDKTLHHAVCDVSFELRPGEILSLLGVNGAGKTTLSSIIASLIPPSQGSVFWNDCSIYDNLSAYRKIVGLCPQYQNLDPYLTLEQNLLFHGRYYGLSKDALQARVEELLATFELEQYAALQVDVLSGGYKQRFLIARTLVHNPQLVILDEPTVGLDPQARRHLWQYILSLKKAGACVLLTTHYLDEAEMLSDRVCVMDRGKVLTIETPEKLKTDLQQKNLEEVFLHLLQKEGI